MNGSWLARALAASVASLAPVFAPPPPSPPAEARPVSVPQGHHVLVNGSFGQGEWADAAAVPLDAMHELLVKQDSRYVYIGIRFLGPRHTGLELYLSARGGLRALHVSSALADRRRGPDGWSEHDWRNEDWGANAIGMVAGEGGPKFLEPEGFEVQLSRAAVLDPAAGRGEIALRVELKRPAAVFPAGTTDGDPAGWIRLAL